MVKVLKPRCEYKRDPIGIDVLVPRLSWQIQSDAKGALQLAYQIQVSKEDIFFENIIWDTGKVNSDQSIHVEYKGEDLESRIRYFYRIRIWDNKENVSEWSETSFWETGLLKTDEWVAHWITPPIFSDPSISGPCPYLRKSFEVKGRVKTARAYITGLGLYELHLNGSRVGNNLFTPGWTSYHKRLQYQTYDITGQLIENKNAIGVVLGDGWYRGDLAWRAKRNTYGDRLAVLVQLHIVYEDGREEIVVSDLGWEFSTGPILMSDIYMGETYDARLEKDCWDTAEYDDREWCRVSILEHSKDILIAQENEPVKISECIKPVGIVQTLSGDIILDMGQNIVGWMCFKVKGQSGTVVTLQHAEVLDREGNFYTENLRKAKQTIKYILKGIGEEIYEPHFTFQGFRYVRIEGYPEIPLLDYLDYFTGKVIHSDMELTGSFKCSDELVNQLQHNIIWSQKGNFLDLPTDCPQRNERLGWTGDAQIFIRTACFNMNSASFFTKWLGDLKADQFENGGVPFIIPDVLPETWGYLTGDKDQHVSACWGDAAVICPWTIYLYYGDKRILEKQYESMKAWVEYIKRECKGIYIWKTGSQLGDWLALDAKEDSYLGATPTEYIATAFFAYSTSILVQTAEILQENKDAVYYKNLHKKILNAFRKEFVTPDGRITVPTQTAQVLALMFELLEDKHRQLAADTLVDYLKENRYHLTTGIVGTPYLCHVLSRNGYNDVAYKLLMQKDYPSWLYQVVKGATTMWEHWDSIKEDGSFWNADMNSFNHYAIGSIGEWLYRVVAGIDTDKIKPGYKHLHIRPLPSKELTYVEAILHSMYGVIKSAWEVKDDYFKMTVIIPPNTTATIDLPFAKLNDIYEDFKKNYDIEIIFKCESVGNTVRLELGSGTYRFVYKMI